MMLEWLLGSWQSPPSADMENLHPQSLLDQHVAALGEQLSLCDQTIVHAVLESLDDPP